jgi:hypothetical protein
MGSGFHIISPPDAADKHNNKNGRCRKAIVHFADIGFAAQP